MKKISQNINLRSCSILKVQSCCLTSGYYGRRFFVSVAFCNSIAVKYFHPVSNPWYYVHTCLKTAVVLTTKRIHWCTIYQRGDPFCRFSRKIFHFAIFIWCFQTSIFRNSLVENKTISKISRRQMKCDAQKTSTFIRINRTKQPSPSQSFCF